MEKEAQRHSPAQDQELVQGRARAPCPICSPEHMFLHHWDPLMGFTEHLFTTVVMRGFLVGGSPATHPFLSCTSDALVPRGPGLPPFLSQESLWGWKEAGTEPPAGGRPAVQMLRRRGSQSSPVLSRGPWKPDLALHLLRRKEGLILPSSLERSSRGVGSIRDQAGREGERLWDSRDPVNGLPGICNLESWGDEGQGFRHGRDKAGFPGVGFPRESTSLAPSDKVWEQEVLWLRWCNFWMIVT